MDYFDACHAVNELLVSGQENNARLELIKLLNELEKNNVEYSPLINHLIREVGLFPYMEPEQSNWQDRYVFEAFKTDVGGSESVTLHREQSALLDKLISGKSIAVSAPTSFGKSFVIDSFIAIQEPTTVVIIVPTIALSDETRRRLQRKFGSSYRIITTPDRKLGERNIFVFPQERVVGYVNTIPEIDLLIVDEFYKASKKFDKERSPSLMRAIIQLNKISKQRYFLAPNINEFDGGAFTEGMEFLKLDFSTVFLNVENLFDRIGSDELKKSEELQRILTESVGKTLVYAGTFSNIEKIGNLLLDAVEPLHRDRLNQFAQWLSEHYDPNWILTKLVVRGVGVHNGQLHRSLSQIEVRLFEEPNALDTLISTSSIIEGVNTSAENVVLWSNKIGRSRLNDFTYKNIIGRGGRMFKHFVGNVFVLEQPPEEAQTQLSLEMPDELLGSIKTDSTNIEYTPEQVARIKEYEEKMLNLVGQENLNYFQARDTFQTNDSDVLLVIAQSIVENPSQWTGLGYLNSNDPGEWERILYALMRLNQSAWETQWSKLVAFIKVLSNNWTRSIPQMLAELEAEDIGINDFFKMERIVAFKLSSLLGDVNTIYNRVNSDTQVDLGPAISRFSHAFLPPLVYQLEEYGLPRMLSRKIHFQGIYDLENIETELDEVLGFFRKMELRGLVRELEELESFDSYILEYFFEGIQ